MLTNKPHVVYFIFVLVTIAFGLFSRTTYIPEWIYPYLGDVLYALMFYWVVAMFFPKQKPLNLMGLSVGICFLIEVSQLYQANWINEIRYTRLGGLVLGFGFLWSDLLSYSLGGIIGFLIDQRIRLK